MWLRMLANTVRGGYKVFIMVIAACVCVCGHCVCIEKRSSLQVPLYDLQIKMSLHSRLRCKQAVRSSHSIF